jgi:hypothetical protein
VVSEEGLVRGEDYETRVLTGTEGYLIRGCSKGLDSWEVFLHEIGGEEELASHKNNVARVSRAYM